MLDGLSQTRLKSTQFTEFYEANPDFDLLAFDFFDDRAVESLNGDSRQLKQALEQLKPRQRLMRLFPHSDDLVRLAGHSAEKVIEGLIDRGLTSAHHVADMAEHQFVREHQDVCGSDPNLAQKMHRRAVQVKGHVRYVCANVRDIVASPFYRATLAANVDPELTKYFESMPSYESLFGSQDYIEVEHCSSILGQAAYFLDIMRITDRYITDPNLQNIPEGYALRDRRPDLFTTLKLDCANTNTLIPYVQLVNEILAEKLLNDMGVAPYKVVATAPYPFNLPFNRPLAQIDVSLKRMDSSLAQVAGSLLAVNPRSVVLLDTALAQAALGLSPETVRNLTVPNTTSAAIRAQYGISPSLRWYMPHQGIGTISFTEGSVEVTGLNASFGGYLLVGLQIGVGDEIRTIVSIDSGTAMTVDVAWTESQTDSAFFLYPLGEARPGSGTISFVKDSKTTTGTGTLFRTLVKGQQIEAGNEVRTISSITDYRLLSVDRAWSTTAENVGFVVYPTPDLTNLSEFRHRAGGLSFAAVEALFRQDLSENEWESRLANTFFINDTGEDLDPLEIDQSGGGDSLNPVTRIKNLSEKRLDRLSRFIRLGNLTGIEPADLDWLMKSFDASEITTDFIRFLANVKRLAEDTSWSIMKISAFVHETKTYGKGNGVHPMDPFDVTFNDPALLAGEKPDSVPSPIPFDPARPLGWMIRTPAGVSGTVEGATENTITLPAAETSDVDGAYNGLVVSITAGTGEDESAVIKSYVGSTRTATLYTDWSTIPDIGSSYSIGNEPGLEGRLAAALQVKKTELNALGKYVLDDADLFMLTLDNANLTRLWRLAKVAFTYRLTIPEYLLLRSILNLPAAAEESAEEALEHLQLVLSWVGRIADMQMSVYELAYALEGTPSRFVRPAYKPEDIPAFVDSLAKSAGALMVSTSNLLDIGYAPDEAESLIEQLRAGNFIDSNGVVLQNETAFDLAAKDFPILIESLETNFITRTMAEAVIAALQAQSPPYLVPADRPEGYQLTINYTGNDLLSYLFVGAESPAVARTSVATLLDEVRLRIYRTIYRSLEPIDGTTAFVTSNISTAQSLAVFGVLSNLTPPVIEPPEEVGGIGYLSGSYDATTPLGDLFVSDAAGQTGVIESYVGGTTRVATVTEPWLVVPDAFTYYRILRNSTTGMAVSGTETTIQLAPDASTTNGAYNGMQVSLTLGAGAGEKQLISSYDGDTQTATIAGKWTTTPNDTTQYSVDQIIDQGNAKGGTDQTIELSDSASTENGAYDTMAIHLVADPDVIAKTAAVKNVLTTVQGRIDGVIRVLATANDAQQGHVFDGIATFLAMPSTDIPVYLPFASGLYGLETLLRDFLVVPPADTQTSQKVIDALSGLTRSALLFSKLKLPTEVIGQIGRMPARYGIKKIHSLSHEDVSRLDQFREFAGSVGDNGSRIGTYFDVWTSVVGQLGKTEALAEVTGWHADDISHIADYLSESIGTDWTGIETVRGLIRLDPVFEVMAATTANAEYLTEMADLAKLPDLGPIGGTVDQSIWAKYLRASTASLALVNARYRDQEFSDIADTMNRSVQTRIRVALVGFAVWKIGELNPNVRTVSDLFKFLLIDVEMTGCDTTSYIAQGITSVQLYMQRARLTLEPGITTDKVPNIWWTWTSQYRVWEANRKVFLYPENYLDPFLRRTASPQFKDLINDLMQSLPTDEHVAKALYKYLSAFEQMADLVHVGGYQFDQSTLESGQVDETALLVARTNTTPYKYYMQEFTRSQIPENIGEKANSGVATPVQKFHWLPWSEVGATIESPFVTPVYAFDRPFLFWNEFKSTKSAKVATQNSGGTESETQSVFESTLKYTFRTATGDWLAPQQLHEPRPMRIMPNEYQPIQKPVGTTSEPTVYEEYLPDQHYWRQPYVQAVPRGIPATGTLTLDTTTTVIGNDTRFGRQITADDTIWCEAQSRLVQSVNDGNQSLVVDKPFVRPATNAHFKVIPKDPNQNSFGAFTGPGLVTFTDATKNVDGEETSFKTDFSIGDQIQCMGETRVVTSVTSDILLSVDRNWIGSSAVLGPGRVYIDPRDPNHRTEVRGASTTFQQTFKVGDTIVVEAISRTIASIQRADLLKVDDAFRFRKGNVPYWKVGAISYTAIPRVDGSARLLAFSGPNLNLASDLPAPPEAEFIKENPGDDPYLSSLNAFNLGLNNALIVAETLKSDPNPKTEGDVTGRNTLILTNTLERQSILMYGPIREDSASTTSSYVRTSADRENSLLYISPETRPLIGLYWGNSGPGTTANQRSIAAGDRALLYHINQGTAQLNGFGNQAGWYLFMNRTQSFLLALVDPKATMVGPSTFVTPRWQSESPTDLQISFRPYLQISFGPYTTSNIAFHNMKVRAIRLTTSVAGILKERVLVGLGTLFSLDSQSLLEPAFNDFYEIPGTDNAPRALDTTSLPSETMDFDGPYGLYFWEIFFHSVLAVAEQLKLNQKFEQAKAWYEYVFNPMANSTEADTKPNDRVWQFRPFREQMTIPSLKEILTNQYEISIYNKDPFNPDAIAQARISAYAKTTLIKYVDNLIKWGDSLFTQDTRESILEATNLYILAHDILGKKPEVVGTFEPHPPMTFDEIDKEFDNNIPQFYIDIENSGFAPYTGQGERFADIPYNDIHTYFGVPENDELVAYWDTIDDRLFKIRHCMNIQGVVRQLALFAPAIDPRALIQAFGAAGSGMGGASFSPYPIPNKRFNYLIGMARSMADNVVRLGGALLSALERKDAEALANLRVTQEARILSLTNEVKQSQVTQLEQQHTALLEAQNSATARQTHYEDLLKNGFLPTEIAQITMMIAAGVTASYAGLLNAASAIGYASPQVGSPFAMTYGGKQIGALLSMSAAVVDSASTVLRTSSEVLGTFANETRRKEDWDLQSKLAEFDVAQYAAQLEANLTQQEMANKDVETVNTQIAQNQAIEQFYKNKFTTEDLFQWMASKLAATYFQAYSLALDFAKMAQRAYQYEQRTQNSILAPNYWDDLRKGLTAGEGLAHALNQIEGAYVSSSRRKFEISKVISLRQLDPAAFLRFVKTGEAKFDLNERLFDDDFPGHYQRIIKTIKITIPALVGPYQNVRATVTQTANRVVLQANINAVRFLLNEDVEVKEGVLEHNVRANQRIVVSRGQGDNGMFEENLNAPLYLPFEETGAISSWSISMPPANNPVDFDSISDVIMEMQYTSLDGGDAFRSQVENLDALKQRDWSALFRPARQLTADWAAFMSGPVTDEKQTLSMELTNLAQANVKSQEVIGFYLGLVVAAGTQVGSANPYITVTCGDGDPVKVALDGDNAVLVVLERPVPLPDSGLAVEISFNLNQGFTPTALKDSDGDRLSAEKLEDINLVLFMSGRS